MEGGGFKEWQKNGGIFERIGFFCLAELFSVLFLDMLIGAGLVLVTGKYSEHHDCRSSNDRRSQVVQKRGVTQNEGCTKHQDHL